MKPLEDQILQNLKQFENHRLDLVQAGPATVYKLHEPGTRMMLALIVFTSEGIALMGDITPERNGSVGTYGYGLGWFAGHKSTGYLCEKFLTQKWSAERAVAVLRDRAEDEEENHKTKLLEFVDELAVDELDERGLYEELDDAGLEGEHDDGLPGYGYDEREAGWLCAIQQKFAELYAAKAELYYLQDTRGYVGNSMAWWAEGGGYTPDLRRAQVFTSEEAFKQSKSRNTDRPWPKSYIDERYSHHVDAQHVNYDEAMPRNPAKKVEPVQEEPKRAVG